MSKSKKTETSELEALPAQSVGEQLSAIEGGLAKLPSLQAKVRNKLTSRNRRVPADFAERILTLVEQNGGSLAGMPIDTTSARATLTQVSSAQAAIGSARRIASKMEDNSVQQQSVVSDRIFAVYTALRRLVNTPEGQTLAGTHEELATMLRNHQKRASAPKAEADATSQTPQPQLQQKQQPQAESQAPSQTDSSTPTQSAPPSPSSQATGITNGAKAS